MGLGDMFLAVLDDSCENVAWYDRQWDYNLAGAVVFLDHHVVLYFPRLHGHVLFQLERVAV